MNRQIYIMRWTQNYYNWTEPQEPEITDFTEAQAVLARIMAK